MKSARERERTDDARTNDALYEDDTVDLDLDEHLLTSEHHA
jgi:hypothetical protein